jgi:hypothetical protein
MLDQEGIAKSPLDLEQNRQSKIGHNLSDHPFIWVEIIFARVIIGPSRWTIKKRTSSRDSVIHRTGDEMPGGQALCIHLHFFDPFTNKEAFVTLAMMHVDGARTRMPMACAVISMLVLALFGSLGFFSWLLEDNHSVPDVQGARSVNAVQSSVPAANAPDAANPPETEPWVRYGREF